MKRALLHGGKLHCYRGRFWAEPGLTGGQFYWYRRVWFTSDTIECLSDRGYLVLRDLGTGNWVEAEVVREG